MKNFGIMGVAAMAALLLLGACGRAGGGTASKADKRAAAEAAASDVLRPRYHYAPLAGWMGRPAGAVRVDGKYHLYYEYNPAGLLAENKHWGHAESDNLTAWTEMEPVLEADSLGEPLGGSVVVDKTGSFGIGKNVLIAMFTATRQDGDLRRQEQCLALSEDGGASFRKFETNPVLRTYDDLEDFRHPVAVRYRKGSLWETVIACDTKLRIYSSDDMVNWNLECYADDALNETLVTYVVGEHPTPSRGMPDKLFPQYESAQLAALPTPAGGTKWVLLCNLVDWNEEDGIPVGSRLKAYIGTFDGHKFLTERHGDLILDYGPDYSGAMIFQEEEGRCLVAGWMGSETYADQLPPTSYCGQMAVARELNLCDDGGKLGLTLRPAAEVEQLRTARQDVGSVTPTEEGTDIALPADDGAAELTMTVDCDKAGGALTLRNEAGEKTVVRLDGKGITLDRSESGWTDGRMRLTAHAPWHKAGTHTLRLLADRTSLEIFADDGRTVLTTLVFPQKAYDRATISGTGLSVTDLTVYALANKNSDKH